jgi:DNA-binding LytR/AlgR family response regulator
MGKEQETNFFEIKINRQSLDIREIFYIEIDNNKRGTKKIHLANSEILVWKTRYNSDAILNVFGSSIFIKIHRNYIINNNHICGRGSKWEYLQICFFIGFLGLKGFLTERIDVGRSYLPQIKKYLNNTLLEIKDEDGDIYFINPIDIIYIELSKEIKWVFLNKSFPIVKNVIKWRTRSSATDIIKSTRIDSFFQVHLRYIINRMFPFIADSGFNTIQPNIKRSNVNLSKKIIPVGAKYKTSVIVII